MQKLKSGLHDPRIGLHEKRTLDSSPKLPRQRGAWLRHGGAARVKLAGSVISSRERVSKQGNRFAFVQCSDASGGFEVTVFSEVLVMSRELLASGKPLLLSADARLEDGPDRRIQQGRPIALAREGCQRRIGEGADLRRLHVAVQRRRHVARRGVRGRPGDAGLGCQQGDAGGTRTRLGDNRIPAARIGIGPRALRAMPAGSIVA